MPIKLIATDLDGTLMAGDHLTVTERTRQALYAAHEKGVKIAIATGRTLDFIDHVTNQIDFVDYVIFSNGASVFDRNAGKTIYTNHIVPDSVERILDFLNSLPVYYNLYFDGGMYIQKNKLGYYENHELPQAFLDSYMKKAHICPSLAQAAKGKSAESVAVFSLPDSRRAEISDFLASEGLVLTSSMPREVEATANGADKGSALSGLCSLLGFSAKDAMSFGDSGNDITMLSAAGYSFAMENGEDICKKTAANIAPPNTEDGVARMVEKYVLGL